MLNHTSAAVVYQPHGKTPCKKSKLKVKLDNKKHTVRGQFQFGECCNASWARDLK